MVGVQRSDAQQQDTSDSSDGEGGKRPAPVLEGPATRVAPCDLEHFPRLAGFRAAHPDVIIGRDAFETWCGIIPHPAGEIVTIRHTLGELLDRLGELMLAAVPDG